MWQSTAGSMAMRLCFALLLCLMPSLVQAQSLQTDRPFTIQASHDCLHTTHYRLELDGQALPDVPASSVCASGTVSLGHSGLATRGRHTVRVAAVNPDHPAAWSAPLEFDVLMPPPTSPGLPSIVEVTARFQVTPQADGTLAVNVLNVGAIVSPAK
jgi:hypothetical protein